MGGGSEPGTARTFPPSKSSSAREGGRAPRGCPRRFHLLDLHDELRSFGRVLRLPSSKLPMAHTLARTNISFRPVLFSSACLSICCVFATSLSESSDLPGVSSDHPRESEDLSERAFGQLGRVSRILERAPMFCGVGLVRDQSGARLERVQSSFRFGFTLWLRLPAKRRHCALMDGRRACGTHWHSSSVLHFGQATSLKQQFGFVALRRYHSWCLVRFRQTAVSQVLSVLRRPLLL